MKLNLKFSACAPRCGSQKTAKRLCCACACTGLLSSGFLERARSRTLPILGLMMPCRCCHAFCRSFSCSRSRIFLRIPSAMAAHPAACWCPDCVSSSLRSELDADVLASTIQSGVSLDRRGFIRLSAEDRPGVRSPVSENACSSPRDIPVASADSSPALRESEIGYPVRTASCASCELLRAEIAALRNELLLARSFSAMERQLRGLAPRAGPSHGSE